MNVLIAEDDAIAASFLGETLKGLFKAFMWRALKFLKPYQIQNPP
jgi:hypothetical protein